MKKLTKAQEARLYYERHISIVCDRLNITLDQYNQFRRFGMRLHRIYENQCNGFLTYQGEWDEEAELRADRLEQKCTDEVLEFAKELGLYIYLQTDPRGATVYLDNKEISDNAYNN